MPAHAHANLAAVTASPKRRYSEATSDGSDGYYNNNINHNGRPPKSPRPDPAQPRAIHATGARPPAMAQSDQAVQPISAETLAPVQQPQNNHAAQQRHAQARMRSSIACVRCRRSKVKCVNSGVGTQCRSCEAGGRECTYPVPVSSGRRRESVVGQTARPEGLVEDQVRKPRQQRKSNAGLPGQPVPIVVEAVTSSVPVDALDATLLTPQVWQELFDIFQLHFSTDLPFIHPPTFLKPLRQATILGPQYKPYASDQPSAVQPPASTEFLLAFLALTARFHPKLVAHHSPAAGDRPSNPIIASDFYACAASTRIKTITGEKLGMYDLETIQAILMLVLHDWGMNRGAQAWAYLGAAIRSAQAMGLHYETGLDNSPSARSIPLDTETQTGAPSSVQASFHPGSSNDAFVQAEIRRRTFWTCFILDRYLSNGKFRPQAINAKDIRIQLPASEQAFLFGERVRTLMLGEEPGDSSRTETRRASFVGEMLNGTSKRHSFSSMNGKTDNEQSKLEIGAEEGLVSRYIKILDIYSRIVKWSCGGGRKDVQETLPPWSHQSQWYSLRRALEDFRTSLPRQHLLTPQNTSAHINIRTSTPYTLVHTTVSLCQILLYREFLPFIPFRHGRPQGPLDGSARPSFAEPIAPQGFWEEGARECFAAARDVMDLVRTTQEWGVAVETPITGFSVYTVALLGIYVINFPWMDTNGYLRRANVSRDDSVIQGAEAARKALEMIGSLRTRLHMAEGWLGTLKRSHKYFARLRTSWFDSAPRMMQGREREVWNDQSIATAQLHPPDAESTRVLLERILRDMDGGYEDDESDAEMTDQGQQQASPKVKADVSAQPNTADAHAQQEERWNAINTAAAAASAMSSAAMAQSTPATAGSNPSTSAHFRFFSSYGGSGGGGATGATNSNPATPSYGHHGGFRPAHPESPSNNSPLPHPQTPGSAPAATWTAANGAGGVRDSLSGIRSIVSPPRRASEAATLGATSGGGSFATPGQSYSAMQQQQRRASEREMGGADGWLIGLERSFGGDDLAAFVDGRDVRGVAKGLKGGWLSIVWGYS